MTVRQLLQVIPGRETSDGAGVRLRRSLGQGHAARLDPFLMLDEFATNNPDDYIAGFPAHPHRGFETVTYMLEGHMKHEDHLGNRGELRDGDVQWMTAGRGIIHSEMPLQREGKLHGFQLWINLPAAEKMKPAAYRDIRTREIPLAKLDHGASARIIAGNLSAVPAGGGDPVATRGPVHGLSTDPLIADFKLPPGAPFTTTLPAGYTACLYVYWGELAVGSEGKTLPAHSAGELSAGTTVEVHARKHGARFLLLAARPLREPIVQYGPFVMNTREEIEQAIADYNAGRLAG